MYGSVFPRLIEKVIEFAGITDQSRFIDIGSGIGNVSFYHHLIVTTVFFLIISLQ
jgi:Histone methylation protein DOT1